MLIDHFSKPIGYSVPLKQIKDHHDLNDNTGHLRLGQYWAVAGQNKR